MIPLMATLLAAVQPHAAAIPPGFVYCPGGTQVPVGQRCPVVDFFWFTYFDANGTSLSREALAVIPQAVASFREERPYWEPRVVLYSHADAGERRPGPLSLARATAVRRALIQLGVSESAVEVRAYGSTFPIVERGPSPQNRLVQIVFFPPVARAR